MFQRERTHLGRITWRSAVLGVTLGSLVLIAAACGGSTGNSSSSSNSSSSTGSGSSSSKSSTPSTPPPAKLTNITVNLGWPTWIPYETPMLVAQKLGYFKTQGLNVSFDRGSGSQTAIQSVATGKELLAWASITTMAQAVNQGLPVISVASIQPKGSEGLIVFQNSGITKPSDLKGKAIGSTPSGSDATLLPPFLKANSLNGKVTVDDMPGDSKLSALLAGKVQAISGQGYYYASLVQSKAGKPASILLYADYGVPVLGHGFVANNSSLSSNGATIQKFLTAYQQGLNYTVQNPAKACTMFLGTGVIGYTQQLCEDQLGGWEKLLTVPATQGKAFGFNDLTLYQSTLQVLSKYANSPAKQPASAYFTNAYLPK